MLIKKKILAWCCKISIHNHETKYRDISVYQQFLTPLVAYIYLKKKKKQF